MIIRAIGDVSVSREVSKGVGELLHSAAESFRPDIVIGNLEVALTKEGWAADKVSVNRSDPANVASYKALNADVWSIGTNHALDWGIPGLLQTLDTLRSNGVAFVGAGKDLEEARKAESLSAPDGTTVAVVNFCSTLPSGSSATERKPGVSPLRVLESVEFEAARMEEQPGSAPRMTTRPLERDLDEAADLIAGLSASHDVVIACLHWGVAWPFLPPNQGPLADYQQVVAQRLVDAGANVIVGTHSHSLHPIEFIGDAVVLYSLGNFLFHPSENELSDRDRRVTPSMHPILRTGPWNDGAIMDIVVEAGVANEVRLTPIVLDDNGEPRRADKTEAKRILERVQAQSPRVTVLETYDGEGVVTR